MLYKMNALLLFDLNQFSFRPTSNYSRIINSWKLDVMLPFEELAGKQFIKNEDCSIIDSKTREVTKLCLLTDCRMATSG